MKTPKMIAILLFASFVFAACNSADSLISQYEKACRKGDAVKAAQIAAKIDKLGSDALTEEQEERLEDATEELAEKALGGIGNVLKDMDF